MIRDILNAIQTNYLAIQPATLGAPVVVAGSGNVGSGVVTCDASTQIFGTYNGYLVVTTGGAPGTAQGQVSLDNGNNVANPNSNGNLGPVFTFPSPTPGYPVPLPALSPGNASPDLSGLVLNFSGNFSVGDTYTFQALPNPTFLLGAAEQSAEDTLFPRVVFFPTDDEFTGTEDYAAQMGSTVLDQRTQQRPLLTDVAHFEAHCWGIDYDRTELLRDSVINAIHFAVQATKSIRSGKWVHDSQLAKGGNLYVLDFSVKKPVMKLSVDTIVAQPPFAANITPLIEDQL